MNSQRLFFIQSLVRNINIKAFWYTKEVIPTFLVLAFYIYCMYFLSFLHFILVLNFYSEKTIELLIFNILLLNTVYFFLILLQF